MRGKKDEEPLQFEKRSPFGFFGTRGKKNPRWEIRGKFVGVRGKRDQIIANDLLDNIERIDSNTDLSPTLGNIGKIRMNSHQ